MEIMKVKRRGKSVPLILAVTLALLCTPCTQAAFAADTGQDTEQAETSYPAYTHMAYKSDSSSPYGTGDYLFSSLKVTGTAMSEEQIFNVYELEDVYCASQLGLASEKSDSVSGADVRGLDLHGFLSMCGVDMSASDVSVSFYSGKSSEAALTVPLSSIKEDSALIAISSGDLPLVSDSTSAGYSAEAANGGGPLKLFIDGQSSVSDLSGIRVSLKDQTEDPHYGYHTRDPLKYMESTVFTVNYIDSSKYTEIDDDAMPFRTLKFTMQQLEQFASDNPDRATGNYFGISGNEAIKDTLGLSGFHDYFSGIDMSWFLTEKTGLKNTEGKAVFYGRDNDGFAEVRSLSYFFADGDYSRYYLEEDNDSLVTGVVPTLAFSKNGYPLLPRHDHEMEGNVNYNTFNKNAEALGFSSKVGIVKNVSGPFVAGLPNLDGVYGGYRNETSGDCIRIDIYADRAQYSGMDTYFSDVSANIWYAEPVNYLASRGVVSGSGDGSFSPAENVTRAEFVTMIAAAAGADVSTYSQSSFDDVDSGSWASPYIEWAADNGIVSGTGDGRFDPDGNITREDMAVIAERYLEYKNIPVGETKDISDFSDSGSIAGYAADSVGKIYSRGIMQGRGGMIFAPLDNSSRAEASAVIAKVMKAAASAADLQNNA